MSILRTPITVYQGYDFELPISWEQPRGTPKNITGYTFLCDVRITPEAPSPVFSLSTGDGIDIISATNGTLKLSISPARSNLVNIDSGSIDFPFTDLYFDLRAKDGDDKKWPVFMGKFRFYKTITRSDNV